MWILLLFLKFELQELFYFCSQPQLLKMIMQMYNRVLQKLRRIWNAAILGNLQREALLVQNTKRTFYSNKASS